MSTRGFTLMEVTLFLAISSALSLVAFVGLGPRLRNVRFTDAVRGVEASVTKAVSDARLGKGQTGGFVCSSDGSALVLKKEEQSTAGTSQACVIAGVTVFFKNDTTQLQYQQVVARRTKTASCANVSLETFYNCYQARPLLEADGIPPGTVDYANGLRQTSSSVVLDGTETKPDGVAIGYVRDPETNKEYLFINGKGENSTAKVCYALGGRKASLNFSTDSIEPKVIFDDEACA